MIMPQAELLDSHIFLILIVQMTKRYLELSFDLQAICLHHFLYPGSKRVKPSKTLLRSCYGENQLVYPLTALREADFLKSNLFCYTTNIKEVVIFYTQNMMRIQDFSCSLFYFKNSLALL